MGYVAYRSQSACDDDAIDPIPIATNAVKYGALSVPSGRLRVEWSRGEAEIVIRWSEADGPPVKPPSHQGFGTRLVGHCGEGASLFVASLESDHVATSCSIACTRSSNWDIFLLIDSTSGARFISTEQTW
jgi:hypothetical protein